MLKKQLQIEYDKIVELHNELVQKNIKIEAELTIYKTWVELGDQKLEKAMDTRGLPTILFGKK